MAEYGSGPFLSKGFDFEIDQSGDIRTTSGITELEKDLAFITSIFLQDIVGDPKYPETKTRTKRIIRDVVSQEPRVGTIDSVEVTYLNTDRDEVDLDVRVVTTDAEQDLVFPVSR